VEKEKEDPTAHPLSQVPEEAPSELQRIRWDTYIGMGLSNLVALAIVITTAATLNAHGVTNIDTSSQAAKALRPIAGNFAFAIFALGIIGTGMLTIPVLAGSAAYALGEAFKLPVGLAYKAHRAKAFYGTIAAAMVVGAVLNFSPLDPVKALFWSAVVNGVVAVPVMAITMMLASRRAVMGEFLLRPLLKTVGWIATVVMLLAAVGMFATMEY
jgi:Mn2+/Fe2+ NRAMP family transporter